MHIFIIQLASTLLNPLFYTDYPRLIQFVMHRLVPISLALHMSSFVMDSLAPFNLVDINTFLYHLP
jgi:hypothetical protein